MEINAEYNCEQRSDEWFMLRCGSLGASQIKAALSKTKSGWGSTRRNLIANLVAERLSGQPTNTYCSPAMQRGIELEEEARYAYEFKCGVVVKTCGLFKHPIIKNTHASPDGLIGDDGLLEIKCPNTATHIDYLIANKVPPAYKQQMLWQMACTNRKWCDFVSYDDRLPEHLQLFIVRFNGNKKEITALEKEVSEFIREVDSLQKTLETLK